MMIIFIIPFIICFMNSIAIPSCRNHIRNTTFRLIIFKEKKFPKLIRPINNLYEKYYIATIIKISDAIEFYNTLSDDERIILDTILALCY
jgi:ribonucleotide reductase beta subunit family protein with ferritin-like domain